MPGRGWKISGLKIVIGTTLTVLAVLGFYYYHFRAQLDRINTRNFRLLATMSTQIEDVVTGYAAVVDSMFLNECPGYLGAGGSGQAEDFLEEQTSLRPERGFLDPPGSHERFVFRRGLDHNTWMIVDAHGASDKTPPPRAAPPCGTLTPPPIHAKVNLTDDIRYLIPDDGNGGPFELILIATKSGRVIYQPPHAQLHLSNIRPLFENADKTSVQKNPAPAPAAAKDSDEAQSAARESGDDDVADAGDPFSVVRETSSLSRVEVAGLAYQLYSQPINLHSVTGLRDNAWVLFALVRPRDLFTEALRVPYPYLFTLISLLALAALALPWLRIRLLSRHEKLRARDVAFGACAAFICAVLIFALPVYLYNNFRFRADTQAQLRGIGRQIQSAFLLDLRQMTRYLDNASLSLRENKPAGRGETQILSKEPGAAIPEPYGFSGLMFWTSSDGHQVYKLSSFKTISPFINVSTQQFFQHFGHGSPSHLRGQDVFIGELLSPTTGKYEMIIGKKVESIDNPIDRNHPVEGAFMVSQARSLFNTVLPPGFGFCLVDSVTGAVQFHSDFRRNQNENLFLETDNDQRLRASVFGGTGLVDAEYRGHSHLMHIQRIEGLENSTLTLVVFADRLFYETLAAQSALVALWMYAGCLILLAVFVTLCWSAIWRKGGIRLIWPQNTQTRRYLCVFLMMSGFSVSMLVWSITGDLRELMFGTILNTLLAAFTALAVLNPEANSPQIVGLMAAACAVDVALAYSFVGSAATAVFALSYTACSCAVILWLGVEPGDEGRRLPVSGLYTMTAIAGIVALSVMPADAFIHASLRAEASLFARYGQKKVWDSIRERQLNLAWLRDPSRLHPSMRDDWDTVDDRTPGLYYSGFHGASITRGANRDLEALGFDPGVEQTLLLLNPPLNAIARDVSGVIRRDLGKGESKWTHDPEAPERIRYLTKLRREGEDFTITSVVPKTRLPASPWMWGGIAFAAVVYYLTLRSGVQRVFRLDWNEPRELRLDRLPDLLVNHQVVLVLTRSSSEDVAIDSPANISWIDCVQLSIAGLHPKELAYDAADESIVGLRNFDYRIDDLDSNARKLDLLERLVYQRKLKVVLVSVVDPLFHFESQPLSDSIRGRWEALLRGCGRVAIEPAAPSISEMKADFLTRLNSGLDTRQRERLADILAHECSADEQLAKLGRTLPAAAFSSEEGILSTIGSRMAPYYKWLWDTCSPDERVALYRLATTRFMSPDAAEAAYQLRRKGLITDGPAWPPMNASFERFVAGQPEPDAPETDPGKTSWRSLEQSAMIVLVALALPLLGAFAVSHGETVQGTLGILGTVFGAVATLVKVLTGRSGGKATDAEA